MNLQKFVKKLLPKFSIVNQKELVKLKKDLAFRKSNLEKTILEAINNENQTDFIAQMNYYIDVLHDIKKVKFKIAFKNFILNVNKFIFGREEIKESLRMYLEISKYRTGRKIFFRSLKDKKFIIETKIANIQNKLKNLDKKLKSRNNGFFMNSLLMLKTA